MKPRRARAWVLSASLGLALISQPLWGETQGLTKVTIGYSAVDGSYLPLMRRRYSAKP